MPVPSLVTITLTTKRYGFKKRAAASAYPGEELPEFFLLECYNPEAHRAPLSLTMRPTGEHASIPFQKLIHLDPGFNRILVPVEEIAALLDLRQPFGIDLTPDHETGEVTLYFGLMEFVTTFAEREETKKGDARGRDVRGKDKLPRETKQSEETQPKESTIKCVVWDLDNTLWHGVLVEDGAERLRLKHNIAEIIRELDQRGVLHSIASKNNAEEALQAVKKFHLDQYFLSPQISWLPKSEGLKVIAQQLNIGMDSLLFVDDSEFELGEVAAACPEVKLLPADQYPTLLERSDCQHPVTSESRERRKLYQVEASRKTVAEQFSNDYMAFLRHCEILLTVRPLTEENLTRVHELTQRTNQMNFSGNRYDRDV
jgi:HAD superfamily phosphatase (TIGR01681 family)